MNQLPEPITQFACPNCQMQLTAPVQQAGLIVQCPSCTQMIIVPHPSAPKGNLSVPGVQPADARRKPPVKQPGHTAPTSYSPTAHFPTDPEEFNFSKRSSRTVRRRKRRGGFNPFDIILGLVMILLGLLLFCLLLFRLGSYLFIEGCARFSAGFGGRY